MAEVPTPSPAPPASTSEIVHATNLSTCVLVVLVLSWCLGGHLLASRYRCLTEGSAACALGLVTGIILLIMHQYLSWEWVTDLLEFNAAGFFTYLLPPVIFYCGLSVEHERFFYALPSILMYGVFGTLTSFALISVFMYVALGFALFKMEDCLAMGAIFAATDSVATLQVLDRSRTPGLFSLVFGEGVVNDAVSVVLLGAVANTARAEAADGSGGGRRHGFAGGFVLNFIYLLITSLIMGAAAGLGIAMALKRLPLTDAHQELAVIALLSYLSYLLADVTGLSGILSLFVCGVVVSHYALHNISEEGRGATLTGFRTASYLAEGIIFIYVGMDALDPLKWQAANAAEALWLVVVLTVLLVAARAAFVVPFSLLHNCWSADKLSSRDIVVIWWAGLMRGAVSVALVYYYFDDNPRQMLDRGRATLIVSTLMVVMLSILGFGAMTKPLLAAMLQRDNDFSLRDQLRTIPLLNTLTHDTSSAAMLLERFDNSFARQRGRSAQGGPGGGYIPNSSSRGDLNSFNGSGHNSNVNGDGGVGDREGAGGGTGGTGGTGGSMWGYPSSDSRGGGSGPSGRGASRLSIGYGSSGVPGVAAPGVAAAAAPAAANGREAPATESTGGVYVAERGGAGNESEQAPLIDLGGSAAAGKPSSEADLHLQSSGASLSFSRYLASQQRQQQQHQGPPAVEMQAGLPRVSSSSATEDGTMMTAMRQMGQAWNNFDREVMQPMFGGPSTPRRGQSPTPGSRRGSPPGSSNSLVP